MAGDPFFEPLPSDWTDAEAALFTDFNTGIGFEVWNDGWVKQHFHDALFAIDKFDYEVRQQKLDELKDHLREQYGIDFDRNFDWDGWREWVTP